MNFAELGLSADVLRAVTDAGYETPTPIQARAIPEILAGHDVLGCAQTGTGKTASFTLPLIDTLGRGRAKARMPRSVILEPTRELATQVAENFDTYGKYHKLSKALLIGGVSYDDQNRLLDRGVDVLIATPGRLLDQFERGRILLNDVKILVIDEADRMLDMGFMPDVERIVNLLPKTRQTLFFSATMPPEIRRLADAFLHFPKEITVSKPATAAVTVTQIVVPAPAQDWAKRDVLRALLKQEQVGNALIFCNRKRDVDTLHKSLKRHGFSVGCLHGDMDQGDRTATLEAFKRGEFTFLVCSDVAARGLDIDAMSHVFNFDVPIHAEDYIHRIGRTGRAGRSGRALTIATREDSKYLAAIERLLGKPIERMENPPVAAPEREGAPERAERRPRGGQRRDGARRDGERSPRAERPRREPAEAPRAARREPIREVAVEAPAPVPAQAAVIEMPVARAARKRHAEPHGFGEEGVPAFLLRGRRASA